MFQKKEKFKTDNKSMGHLVKSLEKMTLKEGTMVSVFRNVDGNQKPWVDRSIQIVILVIALIALIVTAYSYRASQKKKEVTISYFEKRPLMSSDSTPVGSSLKVSFADKLVLNPWILSCRIQNTGSLPIEQQDVEEPIKISFLGTDIFGDIESRIDK